MSYKSGFVAIIGRPNVGKSTLLNSIIGQKVVITSDKAQTTRKRIKGIHSTDQGQIIFVDTPGMHKPIHKLGEFLLEEAKMAVPDSDLILFVVDGSTTAGAGDKWIVEHLKNIDIPVIMIINKVDKIKNIEERDDNIKTYKNMFGEKPPSVIKMSAKTKRNIDTLIKNIFRKLPEGPKYYPDDEVTDQNVRTISEEIIRESILENTRDEIPHSVAISIEAFQELKTLTKIVASIYVEHDSQKGIIIGEQGKMLKKIGNESRLKIEKLIDNKVFLDLAVKVKKDWRKKDSALKNFGYTTDI